MMKSRYYGVLSVLMAVVLMSSCINDDTVAEEVKVGDPIPSFSVEMNDGSILTSQQLISGVSLIMFFYTQCPDCKVTLPEVQKIYDEYVTQGVRFALISREEGPAYVSLYWSANDLTMPYSAQPTKDVYNLFASSRIPRVYICLNGIIKAIFTDNPNPSYEDMKSVLDTMIQ